MKVAVFHALFSELGGGEVFAINLGRALSELGFNVDFYSFELNPRFHSILGDVLGRLVLLKKPSYLEFLEDLSTGRLVRFRRLLLYKYLAKILSDISHNYDLTIDTQSNIPYITDISYIHFPARIDYVLWGFRSPRKTLILRQAYNFLLNRLIKQLCKLGRPKLILTNSSWTAKWVVKAYGDIAPINILYPPVDVEYFSEVVDRYPRENIIITISRFTPEKKLDSIVDLAKRVSNYEFVIVGTTSKYSRYVIKNIIDKVRRLKVKNLRIYTDIPRSELRELLGRAKYYLHPPFPEHFGISVVEAMAAGCIPIVYRDGGVWYDIVSKVSHILGYEVIDEVPNIIRQLENSRDLRTWLRDNSVEISKMFSYEKFREKLSNEINIVLKTKKLI